MSKYDNAVLALKGLCPDAKVGLAEEVFDSNFRGAAVVIEDKAIIAYDLEETTGIQGEGWQVDSIIMGSIELEIQEAEDELDAIFKAANLYRRNK